MIVGTVGYVEQQIQHIQQVQQEKSQDKSEIEANGNERGFVTAPG